MAAARATTAVESRAVRAEFFSFSGSRTSSALLSYTGAVGGASLIPGRGSSVRGGISPGFGHAFPENPQILRA